MAAKPLSGLFGYGESELEPAIQAEIHLETARNEARIAILEILIAIGFGVWFGLFSSESKAVYLFTLLTVVPLLVDGTLRRTAARRLLQR